MIFSFTSFVYVIFIIAAGINVASSENVKKIKRSYENYTTYESFGAYRSLESLMKVLNEHSDEPHVKELLKMYYKVCPQPFPKNQTGRKRTLIAVEGLLTGTMNKIPELLAQSLDARFIRMPPDCLMSLKDKFRDGVSCTNEYTALCRYAASNVVSHTLRKRPAVIQKQQHINKHFYNPEVIQVEFETKSWASCLQKMHVSILKVV